MTAIDAKYKGNWENVQPNCLLCDMEKRTEWHLETTEWVVAEKLGGGPFIVSKKHQQTLSEDEWAEARRITRLAGFEDFELRVLMNLVEDHWHAHLVFEDENPDLSRE